jgi:hypothetical protein
MVEVLNNLYLELSIINFNLGDPYYYCNEDTKKDLDKVLLQFEEILKEKNKNMCKNEIKLSSDEYRYLTNAINDKIYNLNTVISRGKRKMNSVWEDQIDVLKNIKNRIKVEDKII